MWGYKKKLTDEEIEEFIIEYIEYGNSFSDFIYKMKEKELSQETVLKIIDKMGYHYSGFSNDFSYFYTYEEYKYDYADFEDEKIHWWYSKCNKLEEKEKQSIINKMIKNHPCEYTLFDFLQIIHPVKPTIEDTLDILGRLKEIGYVTICVDFYNLFYDSDSFLSELIANSRQNSSSYQKTTKSRGFFSTLFSSNESSKSRDDYDAEDGVYDMQDEDDYQSAYDEYDEEDLDDIE